MASPMPRAAGHNRDLVLELHDFCPPYRGVGFILAKHNVSAEKGRVDQLRSPHARARPALRIHPDPPEPPRTEPLATHPPDSSAQLPGKGKYVPPALALRSTLRENALNRNVYASGNRELGGGDGQEQQFATAPSALAVVVRQPGQSGHDGALSGALPQLRPHARRAHVRQADHRHRADRFGLEPLQSPSHRARQARARGYPRRRRRRLRVSGPSHSGDRQAADRCRSIATSPISAWSRCFTAIRSTAWC